MIISKNDNMIALSFQIDANKYELSTKYDLIFHKNTFGCS